MSHYATELCRCPLISVASGGSSVLSTFVQVEPFYSGRDLYILESREEISLESKLFITTLIEANKYRYSFGRQANKTLSALDIKLPIQYNPDGSPLIDVSHKFSDEGFVPNWDYMDNYIKSLHYKPLTTNNRPRTRQCDNTSVVWKKFLVSSILTIDNGKGITNEEIEENPGDLPAVQSGEENNGVIGYIDLDYCRTCNYTYTLSPCLTIARTGSAGYVGFQRYGCVVGDSAKILKLPPEHSSSEIYLFVQTLLQKNRIKYDYGRKVTKDKYLSEDILLPVLKNNDGTPFIDQEKKYSPDGFVPDWDYMEAFIRTLPYGDRIIEIDSEDRI